MSRFSDSPLVRQVAALLAVVVALGARLLLNPVLGERFPFATLFFAVLFAAWFGGFAPALTAAVAGAVGANWVLLEPRGAWLPNDAEERAGLVLYLCVSFGIAMIGGAMRAAQLRAEGRADELGRRQQQLEREMHERHQAEQQVRAERERFRITLASIGDAVITTDPEGRVTFLNPIAEALTGWPLAAAAGLPLASVFQIRNEQTRRPAADPVAKVLADGRVVGLANHTLLIRRDGAERPIDDSAAPIRQDNGSLIGVVLVFRDISERKQSELALRESEAKLQAIVDNMTASVYVKDRAGRYLLVNRYCEERFFPRERMLGRTDHELFAPEDADAYTANDRQVFATGQPLRAEEITRDAAGLHTFLSLKFPLRDAAGEPQAVCGVSTDITDRKRVEDVLRFQSEASAALASSLDYEKTLAALARLAVPHLADWCAIDMAEPDGSLRRLAVAHVDPARVQLAHELHRRFPPDPQAPHGTLHVLRTGQPEMISEISDGLLADLVKNPELLAILRELGVKSYLGVPLRIQERTLGVITLVAAESGRRYGPADLQAAEDLARRAALAVENARLYQEVREADRRKDEFLATLAHELRNPLAPIRNSVQVMRHRGLDDPHLLWARDVIDRQVQQLTRLVDDLLDISRITRGKIELRKEVIDLAVVVSRAVETTRPLLEERRHELALTLPTEPLFLEADPTRLEQILGNLLNNAAKYTEPGGIIELSADAEETDVALRVRDSGTGIAPELLLHIFEMFVQVDQRRDRHTGGLGIGLSLVRNLVQMHGGSVHAASAGKGQGSVFTVRLPLPPNLQPPPRADSPSASRPLPASPVGRRILVVDDNTDAADSLALLLRLDGHDVRVAHNGPAGLESAQAHSPELVILDIGMPGMDGYEVARRLRQLPNFHRVTLAALTGWGQLSDQQLSHAVGFDYHLVKPVDLDELKRLVAGTGDHRTDQGPAT